jgi:hypothetical protein
MNRRTLLSCRETINDISIRVTYKGPVINNGRGAVGEKRGAASTIFA